MKKYLRIARIWVTGLIVGSLMAQAWILWMEGGFKIIFSPILIIAAFLLNVHALEMIKQKGGAKT